MLDDFVQRVGTEEYNVHRRALALHFMDAMASTADPTRKKEPLEHVPVLRGTSVPW